MLWVGLPAVRGTKSTSDMSYLDELYRARAEKAGIIYVDIWDGFVDEQRPVTVQGPDFEGQIRRLRTGDGVHFTKFGAVKLARYVEHDLRRVMTNHVVPVALPGPEEQPAKPARPRPPSARLLPLTAVSSVDGGDLLGDGQPPGAGANPIPIATRVLSHGDPIAARPAAPTISPGRAPMQTQMRTRHRRAGAGGVARIGATAERRRRRQSGGKENR